MRQKMLGIVVLSALAGLPVSAAVCAALCDPSGSAGATGSTGKAMSHGAVHRCRVEPEFLWDRSFAKAAGHDTGGARLALGIRLWL